MGIDAEIRICSVGFGLTERRSATLCNGRDLLKLHQSGGPKLRRKAGPSSKQSFDLSIVWECSGSNSLSRAVSLGQLMALWRFSLR